MALAETLAPVFYQEISKKSFFLVTKFSPIQDPN